VRTTVFLVASSTDLCVLHMATKSCKIWREVLYIHRHHVHSIRNLYLPQIGLSFAQFLPCFLIDRSLGEIRLSSSFSPHLDLSHGWFALPSHPNTLPGPEEFPIIPFPSTTDTFGSERNLAHVVVRIRPSLWVGVSPDCRQTFLISPPSVVRFSCSATAYPDSILLIIK